MNRRNFLKTSATIAGVAGLLNVAVLHLLRFFLTGEFGPGRQLNWIIGLNLLLLVLCANFSGYLLPWDQQET